MTQSETLAFLSSKHAFDSPGRVDVVETHAAYVFLCGDTALKLKRAVKYDYMDQSTVALRHALIARELELNRPAAPGIYRDMLPVTRGKAGLALGGEGEVVDWVLRMWRFPAENELANVAAAGGLDDGLSREIGRAIAAYHAAAPVRDLPGRVLIGDILGELDRVFAEFPQAAGTARLAEWRAKAERRHRAVGGLLDARGRAGHVRRVHGDLHLRNLVLIEGKPVLYDALEFDETLGTCDVLYDVAFLLMDLCQRGFRRQACRVLDSWLGAARGAEDAGLAALPLFLSVRAAIRAMVLVQTDAVRRRPSHSAAAIGAYLDLACDALAAPAPLLVAIGGCSGSGKSVLAHALAPRLGPLPGAVLLNSDLERKAGLRDADRATPIDYAKAARDSVYRAMVARAARLLAAGHSVVLDATFLDPRMRGLAETTAREAGAAFRGIWLDAPQAVLAARVAARTGDASDADLGVLNRQLGADHGDVTWQRIDGDAAPGSVLAAAEAILPPDAG